jgi:ABC-type thiamine transport system ATPase subunit
MEEIMGFDDIQKNLHKPSLLLDETFKSLHEMTRKSNNELIHLDARVI